MQSERHTPGNAALLPVLLIALAATAVPVHAQGVPFVWSLPTTEPGYVSLSGAVTFGFSASPKELPADPIGMVPPESEIPGLCRRLFDEMWRGSATFRRQWTRLAGARVRVTIVLAGPMLSGWTRAHAQLLRTPDLRVRIWLPLVSLGAVEYLAHEIEHVLEALDDVDLPLAVAQGVHGATAGAGKLPVFESNRAKAIGRLVAREVEASKARR
jgi:hypothetical protein